MTQARDLLLVFLETDSGERWFWTFDDSEECLHRLTVNVHGHVREGRLTIREASDVFKGVVEATRQC